MHSTNHSVASTTRREISNNENINDCTPTNVGPSLIKPNFYISAFEDFITKVPSNSSVKSEDCGYSNDSPFPFDLEVIPNNESLYLGLPILAPYFELDFEVNLSISPTSSADHNFLSCCRFNELI